MILSNGLGNIETTEKYVDRQKIYAGVTLWSSELEGPGHIMATGTGTIELQPVASGTPLWKKISLPFSIAPD